MKSPRLFPGAWLLAGGMALFTSLPALAQNIAGSWEITGVGGGYFGKQIYENTRTVVDTATTFEYGARVGYNLTEGIAFEGAWTYAKPNLEATALTVAGATGKIGELKSNTYEVDGLFSVGNDWASFYIVLGIGATTLQPVIAGIETRSSTDLSGSAGIGGKLWLGRNFGLRLEGRWRWVSTGNTSAGVWCDSFGNCYVYTTNVYGHADVTAGLTVRF